MVGGSIGGTEARAAESGRRRRRRLAGRPGESSAEGSISVAGRKKANSNWRSRFKIVTAAALLRLDRWTALGWIDRVDVTDTRELERRRRTPAPLASVFSNAPGRVCQHRTARRSQPAQKLACPNYACETDRLSRIQGMHVPTSSPNAPVTRKKDCGPCLAGLAGRFAAPEASPDVN